MRAFRREWQTFSLPARRYLLMHVLGAVLMAGYVIYPVYLKILGLTIVIVGALYTLADIARVGLTYLAGRWLDGRGAKTGIALDWLLSGIGLGIYAVSSRFWHLVTGRLVETVAILFYAGSQAYENEAYEEHQRERIFAYHMGLPYLVQVPLFPLIAFALARWWPTVTAYRWVIGGCGIGMTGVALYAATCLPNIGILPAKERAPLWPRIPRSLLSLVAIELLVSTFSLLGSGFVVAFLIIDRFQGTVFEVVLLHVLWGVVTILVTGVTRNWNTRFTHQQLICGGVALLIVADVVLLACQHLGWFFLVYGLTAAGWAVWFVQHQSLKMRLVPEGSRNEFHAAVLSARNLIGLPLPLLTGLLAKQFGMKAPFAVQLVGWIAVWIAYWLLLRETRQELKNS